MLWLIVGELFLKKMLVRSICAVMFYCIVEDRVNIVLKVRTLQGGEVLSDLTRQSMFREDMKIEDQHFMFIQLQ